MVQENNSHNMNEYITSSDPQVQLLHHHKHMTHIHFKVEHFFYLFRTKNPLIPLKGGQNYLPN